MKSTRKGTLDANKGTLGANKGTLDDGSGTLDDGSGTLDANKGTLGGDYGTLDADNGTVGGDYGTVGAVERHPQATHAVQRSASSEANSRPSPVEVPTASTPVYQPSWTRRSTSAEPSAHPAAQPTKDVAIAPVEAAPAVAVQRIAHGPVRRGSVGRPVSRSAVQTDQLGADHNPTVQRSMLPSIPSGPVPLAEMFSPARRFAEAAADRAKQTVPDLPQSVSDIPQRLPNLPNTPDVGGIVDSLSSRASDAVADATALPAMPPKATGTTPAAAGSPDLEELARQLYEPITARLRAELWLDRERIGLLTER